MAPSNTEELRAKEIWSFRDLKALGIVNDRATLRRRIASEGFSQPVILGPNSVGWIADEVRSWLASRPRGPAPQPLRVPKPRPVTKLSPEVGTRDALEKSPRAPLPRSRRAPKDAA
jgi:predicted DNA-binding transcriptional regulator AlpA